MGVDVKICTATWKTWKAILGTGITTGLWCHVNQLKGTPLTPPKQTVRKLFSMFQSSKECLRSSKFLQIKIKCFPCVFGLRSLNKSRDFWHLYQFNSSDLSFMQQIKALIIEKYMFQSTRLELSNIYTISRYVWQSFPRQSVVHVRI